MKKIVKERFIKMGRYHFPEIVEKVALKDVDSVIDNATDELYSDIMKRVKEVADENGLVHSDAIAEIVYQEINK